MERSTKFKVGDLVIHSGSHARGETENSQSWGVVMECSQPQIEFGRWRSILVHWIGQSEQSWISPRSIYLVEEAIEENESGLKWDLEENVSDLVLLQNKKSENKCSYNDS